jgi:YD repeat-containing protein
VERLSTLINIPPVPGGTLPTHALPVGEGHGLGVRRGGLISATQDVQRTTTFARDGAGYVTLETEPTGATVAYLYQNAFHALTGVSDERQLTSSLAYDS